MKNTTKVALITGAGSGLGRELARQLAQDGTAIAALDQNKEALHSLEVELAGKTVGTAVADVRHPISVGRAVRELEQKVGPTDLLIVCAGIGRETPAVDFRVEDWEALIQINLLGVGNTVAAVLPGMLERKRGHITAISSLASFRGLPAMAGYCAAKAGVNALMDSLRVELSDQGIHFTTICPGWIRTPLIKQLAITGNLLLEPSEAAARILSAIRRRKIFYAFPLRLAIRLRLLQRLPLWMSDWLIRWRFTSFRRQKADGIVKPHIVATRNGDEAQESEQRLAG